MLLADDRGGVEEGEPETGAEEDEMEGGVNRLRASGTFRCSDVVSGMAPIRIVAALPCGSAVLWHRNA